MHVTKILNFIFLTHYNKIGISWMKSIYVNERQGENQMAVFGNVQKLPFAFFPLSSHFISTAKSIFDIAFFSSAAQSDYFPSTFWMRIANPPERARCIFNVVLELTFFVVMEYVCTESCTLTSPMPSASGVSA